MKLLRISAACHSYLNHHAKSTAAKILLASQANNGVRQQSQPQIRGYKTTSSHSARPQHSHPMYDHNFTQSKNKLAAFMAAAVAGVTGVTLLSSLDNTQTTTSAEAPKYPKQAAPIDWNVVFSMSRQEDDDDDDDSKDKKKENCGCKNKKKDDDDEDCEDKDDCPEYIPEHARKDLGNSLNHHTTLGVEAQHILRTEAQYPLQRAELTMAPNVPPPCNRNYPVHLVVDIMTLNKKMRVQGSKTYEFWPFAFLDQAAGKIRHGVPGPFIRARVGDILQVNHTNKDESGMAHSIDFHSVCGPGGGSPTTFAEQDETRTGAYRLMKPGLFIYHCAAAPIPLHIHNGTYSMLLAC